MMNETKHCKVQIFGDEYTFITDEASEHILRAAHMIDSLMKEIAEKSGISNEKKLAILAGVRMASKVALLEADSAQKQLREQRMVESIDSVLDVSSFAENS